MALTSSARTVSAFGEFSLALVRIVIGWHFLYEGFTKLLAPGWTSAGYLQSSAGPAAGFYHWLGSQETMVAVIDQLNIWGLVFIGLALMLGLAARPAAVSGIALLALYYVAYPPLFTPGATGVSEGHYLIVNKNLVELFALIAVAAFPAASFGIGGLLAGRGKRGAKQAVATPSVKGLDKPVAAYLGPISRRQALSSLAGVPFLGAFVLAALKKHGWKSFEEVQLAGNGDDFVSSATVKTFQFTSLTDLKGRLPHGQIGNLKLSRMILGGNLMGGWAHARDLIYVSKLVRAYHNRDKLYETMYLAETCGVNTLLTNPLLCGIVNDYWREGGRIQFISDCGGEDLMAMIQQSIDSGACACYIQGGIADRLVQEGQFDMIAKALDLIRGNKLPAGIGAHSLATVQECVDRELRPDFWMKTLHRTDYWSATPTRERDNIWCEDPAATVAYMKDLEEPWIAFKILAAGAIHPDGAFKYAFDSGADFICVGMYDFQIVDDVNIALDVLNGGIIRQRPWRA